MLHSEHSTFNFHPHFPERPDPLHDTLPIMALIAVLIAILSNKMRVDPSTLGTVAISSLLWHDFLPH